MTHYTHSRRAFIQGSVGALALGALAACSNGDSKDSGSNKPAAKGSVHDAHLPTSMLTPVEESAHSCSIAQSIGTRGISFHCEGVGSR